MRVVRWFLAIVFLVYGGIKLAGGQFWHGDFLIDSRTVNGPSFVWAFFGWKTSYAIFAGLGEFVPALLLFVPRTATLGALLLFPVALNITVMTFAFGFPGVKYASLVYTVLLGALIAHELPRLWPVVVPRTVPPVVPFGRVGRVLLLALGIPSVLTAAAAVSESLSPTPEATVRQRLIADGVPNDSIRLRRSRYTGQLLGREGFVEYEWLDSSRTWRAGVSKRSAFSAWRIGDVVRDSAAR